jgi:hypothetical protein
VGFSLAALLITPGPRTATTSFQRSEAPHEADGRFDLQTRNHCGRGYVLATTEAGLLPYYLADSDRHLGLE